MFTTMIESKVDPVARSIMVRIDGEWKDVRFVEGHRGLQNAAWVMHNRAMENRLWDL